MQYNNIFVAATLLPSTVSAVTFTFNLGANCAGMLIDTSTGSGAGDCIYLSNGGSAKSISYSGVPSGSQVLFFESGGAHDECTNGAILTLGSGSGCANAPDGFNLESVKWQ